MTLALMLILTGAAMWVGLLGIDARVLRNYLGMTYDKIGVSNRVELALWYEARVQASKLPWRFR
jgi:hypothetical protein